MISEVRLIYMLGFAAMSVSLVGCYSMTPATRGIALEPGTLVTFDVNDAGRTALGGSMGPEIVQVEGKVLEIDQGDYMVGISGVRFVGGGEQAWKGERVRIKPEYVRAMYERHFSKGKTVIFTAGVVGAAAYLATRSLFGFGTETLTIPACDTCTVNSIRIPRH